MKQDIKDENAVFAGERFIGVYRKVLEGDIIARSEWVLNLYARDL